MSFVGLLLLHCFVVVVPRCVTSNSDLVLFLPLVVAVAVVVAVTFVVAVVMWFRYFCWGN